MKVFEKLAAFLFLLLLIGAKFIHSNQTQGVGIGYDGIFAAGSSVSQDMTIKQKGNGVIRDIWQNPTNLAIQEFRNAVAAAVVNMGFRIDHYTRNVLAKREYIMDITGDGNSFHDYVNIRAGNAERRAYVSRAAMIRSNVGTSFGANNVHKDKIVVYSEAWNGEQFMGFGVESVSGGAVTYQSYGNWDHRFYHAFGNADGQTTLLMNINSNGNVGIGHTAAGGELARLDVKGGAIVGDADAIDSQRNAAKNAAILNAQGLGPVTNTAVAAATPTFRMFREGTPGTTRSVHAEYRLGSYVAGLAPGSLLELWMSNTSSNQAPNVKVIHFRADGRINTPLMPTFNSDAAAATGGLVAGDWFKTAAGVLHIKL